MYHSLCSYSTMSVSLLEWVLGCLMSVSLLEWVPGCISVINARFLPPTELWASWSFQPQDFQSCLENPMDRGAWQAAVHGVTQSWTRLNDLAGTHDLSLFYNPRSDTHLWQGMIYWQHVWRETSDRIGGKVIPSGKKRCHIYHNTGLLTVITGSPANQSAFMEWRDNKR